MADEPGFDDVDFLDRVVFLVNYAVRLFLDEVNLAGNPLDLSIWKILKEFNLLDEVGDFCEVLRLESLVTPPGKWTEMFRRRSS